MEQGVQILKTRDDHSPVRIQRTAEISFVLSGDEDRSWVRTSEPFGTQELRPRIEPWLTALAQSEHLSLLVGSGLTHAVHSIATGNPAQGMTPIEFDVFGDAVSAEAARLAELSQREQGNFEDQIRVATELLRGLEILPPDSFSGVELISLVSSLRGEIADALTSFTSSVLESERALVSAPDEKRRQALAYLANFLMSFASRSGTRERLNLFTTNYDRYIETGADLAGLRVIDRFVGTLAPVFRASRLDIDLHYHPPGIRGEPRYLEGVARFTKLHGSVDWIEHDGAIRRLGLPFGATDITSFLTAAGLLNLDARHLMIYPNAAKDRETAHYPYVELFRDLATAICRPNSTLICYGYGFGDEHINRVIEDMLTIPSSHLVIISYGDPLGRVMNTYERLGRPAQLTLLVGDHLGDLCALVDRYLPKPAIDRTTFRMAELLRARWNTPQTIDVDRDATLDGVSPAP